MNDVVFWANVRFYLAVVSPLLIGFIGIYVVYLDKNVKDKTIKYLCVVLLIFIFSGLAVCLMMYQLKSQAMQVGPPLSLLFNGIFRALLPMVSGIVASIVVGMFAIASRRLSSSGDCRE